MTLVNGLVRDLLTDSTTLAAVWKLTHAEAVELAQALVGVTGPSYSQIARDWIKQRRPELLEIANRQIILEAVGKYPEYPD